MHDHGDVSDDQKSTPSLTPDPSSPEAVKPSEACATPQSLAPERASPLVSDSGDESWKAEWIRSPSPPLQSRDTIGSEWLAGSAGDVRHRIGPKWLAGDESNSGAVDNSAISVSEVRSFLRSNRLFVKDDAAAERGATLVAKAIGIIDEKRHSSMSSESANSILKTLKFYSTKNEKTLLINLWQLLINETRFRKKILDSGEQEALTPAEKVEAADWIKKAWVADDSLWTKWDAEFFVNTIPEISTWGDPTLDALLAAVPRIAKPKPDIGVGFDERAFSETVRLVLDKFSIKLTAKQYLTFFAVEAKGADGTMGEAENQCCRGGAAMVKACRDFLKATNTYLKPPVSQGKSKTPPPSPTKPSQPPVLPTSTTIKYPRPDTASFAFSLALTPDLAKLFVHWAEVTDGDPDTHQEAEVWQQTELRQYLLHDVEYIRLLRFNIDNIQDWGCRIRKRNIETQSERYANYMATLDSAGKKTASKAAKEALENRIIKRQKISG